MTPVPEWRRVLKHAWSVRIMAACAVLSAAGGALLWLDPHQFSHPAAVAIGAFALTAIGNVGGIVARVVQQKRIGAKSEADYENGDLR